MLIYASFQRNFGLNSQCAFLTKRLELGKVNGPQMV